MWYETKPTILAKYCRGARSSWPLLYISVQSLSRVRLFATPWVAARQACLSITNSPSSLRLASIESVMPSSHLILCHPLLLLLPIPPSIKVFSNESTLHFRWPHTQNSVVQFTATTTCNGASLVAQRLKHLPPRKETWVRSLGREDPLENGNPLQYSCLENPMDREA